MPSMITSLVFIEHRAVTQNSTGDTWSAGPALQTAAASNNRVIVGCHCSIALAAGIARTVHLPDKVHFLVHVCM